MKKILLSAALIAMSIGSFAQTVKKDTVCNCTYASIVPVQVFPNTATRISLRLISDNLDKDSPNAKFLYRLLNENGEIIKDSNVMLSGKEYADWNSNSLESTYDLIATKLNLTIID